MEYDLSQTRLLKADEVAKILSIGRATVYLLYREGKIPYVKIGSSVRFPEAELKRWLTQRTTIPEV